MNKKQLLAYPIVSELKSGQIIDSNQLNEIIKSIESSVLRAILRANEFSEKVTALNLGVINSYNSLYQHSKSYLKYPDYVNTIFATAFDKSISGGTQNQNAGVVTLEWNEKNKLSKIPVYEGVVSPNIRIFHDNVLRNNDDSIYNIFDKDSSSFWIEEVPVSDPTIHTLELYLPPTILKTFNFIEIVPFPIFGVEILKIEYQDAQSISNVIFDSDYSSQTYVPYRFYNNSGPIVMHLSPKETNGYFKLSYKVKDGCSAIGFSNIDIAHINYEQTSTTILIPFENLPNVSSITPTLIDLDFYIDSPNNNSLNSFFNSNGGGIFITDNNGNDLEHISPIQGPQERTWSSINISNGLYLKLVINEVNGTSPMFRGCKLEYTI